MGPPAVPVLAVAQDALDTQDALQLWSGPYSPSIILAFTYNNFWVKKVFSKCKNSLQDGRRLENISWRLSFRDLPQNKRLLEGPWPPTPESVCSDDSSGTKSSSGTNNSSSSAATSPFFHIASRSPTATPVRPAGRIISDMIPPGLTQKLIEHQKDKKKVDDYPTPSSSSSGSASASSSSVSISVESPAPATEQEVQVPRVNIVNPTPNLTPHPTPPATPLLAASAPRMPATPTTPPTRREAPGPLFLPRSATRGMGSPVFPPVDSSPYPAAAPVPYAPQSTHILPLGGRELTVPAPSTNPGNAHLGGCVAGKTAPRGTSKFFLHAGASGSSHSSSRSSGTSSNSYENDHGSRSSGSGSGSESSRERGEGGSGFVHGQQRGVGTTRGRGRGRGTGSGGRHSSSEEAETHQQQQREEQQQKPLAEQKQQPQQLQQPTKPPISHQQPLAQPPTQPPPQKPPRVASAPFLGGLALEMTAAAPHAEAQANGRRAQRPEAQVVVDAEDTRSVSSMATSSSHLRMRARGKQPVRTAMRSDHSRSRSRASRKGGTTRVSHAKEKEGGAPNVLGLPSNLAAAAALVERTMSGRRLVVLATSDEDWSDDDDESAQGTESVEGEGEVEEAEEEEEDEGWEDEDENESQSQQDARAGPHPNAKAPPPSLQQQPPPNLGHARGHSTGGGSNTGTDLRQLPTRPTHRSTSHLPALAGAGAGPAHGKHHHTTSEQNARTVRALKATMSATTISGAMQEAKRQRDMFAKAPRYSYENLTQLAGQRPGGLTLLLGGRPQIAEQYHQQQQLLQQQQQIGGLPPPRARPAGGFGGLGLTMSSARPPPTGGVELSPIPPTPATAALQQQQQPAARRQQQQPPAPVPPSPRQQQHEQQQQQQQQPGPPPRRPGMMPRAFSSSALPPHLGAGTSGSFGKSSVAGPVVSVADPGVVGGGPPSAPLAGVSNITTQNGSAGAGRSGGYRPKGPPAEMEYDDEEDDESDADGRSGKGKGRARDEGLQLSKSVAQEKLRVLAEKNALSRAKNSGATAANGTGGDSMEAERRRLLYEQAGVVPWAAAANNHNVVDDYVAQQPPNRSMSTAPVGFPYNLPLPAPPSTPRTTRQQMLRNEMSESLRHNLLWQRKLSRTDTIGPQPRRSKSTMNVPGAGQQGRQAEKNLVRLTPRAPGSERRETVPPMDGPVQGAAPTKKKLVRNLSWADTSDYHQKGW
ncbi:hypothetical protein B0H19DRAFT_1267380 [Mycena capillaripes]|nr:hypothetical protein B0H19DRAFT_1267380 [Mycena capillaripes]